VHFSCFAKCPVVWQIPYKDGSLTTLEHVKLQHGSSSTATLNNGKPKGRFYSDDQISTIIDKGMTKGTLDTSSSPWKVTHRFVSPIGTDIYGQPTHNLMIYLRNGLIQTAFPF
jgi:hypothetical protein